MERIIKGTGEFICRTNGENTWKLLGPGGGGAQYIPGISPHNPDKMFVACDMTGGYLTEDGGRMWTKFNLRTRIDSFSFDPVDPQTLYAGSTGLYRSKDGGKSWRLLFPNPKSLTKELMLGDHADHSFVSVDNWPGGTIQYIRIDEHNNKNLYIGIQTDNKPLIYFSEDYGASWSAAGELKGIKINALYLSPMSTDVSRYLYCFSDKEACSIKVDEKSCIEKLKLPGSIDSIVHVACGAIQETGLSVFYIISSCINRADKNSVLWKSEDRGLTWCCKEIKLDGRTSIAGVYPVPEISFISVSEKYAETVYAAVGKYPEIQPESASGSISTYFGVIKSSDGGETWKWVFKSDYAVNPSNLEIGWPERDYDLTWYMTGPKGAYPMGLGVSPVNADICCMTDWSSTFHTSDGGIHWKQLCSTNNSDGSVSTTGLDVTTCYGVHFDPFDREHIAVSYTDIGMFHSKDRGSTWRHSLKHVPVAWGNTCYWIVFDPDIKGKSWSAWGGAHDLPRPKMMRSGRFHFYEGGICKSDDNMETWSLSNDGMPGNSVITHVVLDASSPAGKRTLYAAGYDKGVYKSTDDGYSWTLKNNGISGNLNAWRLVMLPDGTLYLLVARGLRNKQVIDGAVYKYVDGAELWENVSLPFGVNAPNDLVFDPNNPKCMYLACWPIENERKDEFGGLYATEDGGDNWRNIFDPSSHVYSAAVHPDNPSVLFIVTFDSAAYRSDNKGKTWLPLKGYDFKWGHRPIIDPYNSEMLYITTFGSSVWYGPVDSQKIYRGV